jgi:tryptophanyl-tRNA synthetase
MSFDEMIDRANDYLELKMKCEKLIEKWHNEASEQRYEHGDKTCASIKELCADELEEALK